MDLESFVQNAFLGGLFFSVFLLYGDQPHIPLKNFTHKNRSKPPAGGVSIGVLR